MVDIISVFFGSARKIDLEHTDQFMFNYIVWIIYNIIHNKNKILTSLAFVFFDS